MNLMHERVCHPQFGDGVITEQTEAHVKAEFSNGVGTKKFIYPLAFEKHLLLCNEALSGKIAQEVQAYQAAQAALTTESIEKMTQKREEVRLEQLQQKKGAARKSSAAAKKKAAEKMLDEDAEDEEEEEENL